jgi:uncharacterized protein YndB with AHSA1/START domain/cytochrome c556
LSKVYRHSAISESTAKKNQLVSVNWTIIEDEAQHANRIVITYRALAMIACLAVIIAPGVAMTDETITLKVIMQDLRGHLADITDGLLADDFGLVARGANGIAEHPHIPAEQVALVAKELGEQMAVFKQLDTWVHDLSLEMRAAAEKSDRGAMVSNYQKLVAGCIACHNAYRERVAAVLNADSESSTSAELPILQKEIVVRASLEDVWRAWTTAEGLAFISSRSNIELRVGGAYDWFLDGEPDAYGRHGSEGSYVLAYLPKEMLAFSWTFPPDIPELRYADKRTQVVVRFNEDSEGQVHVRLQALGWKEGEAWQRGWDYFDNAWGAVLTAMKQHLE